MAEEATRQPARLREPADRPVKVSVAMITYNHERFVAQAIESALMQQVDFSYEIVIGEDCSTDSTRDIVIDYANRYPDRVRALLRERNVGGDRNTAETLAACQGEYVAWLEGDDYWISPDKLQKQVDFLDSHPECAMCFHNVRVFWDDGSREPFDHNPPGQREILGLEHLLPGCIIQAGSVMVRRVLCSGLPDWARGLLMVDWVSYLLIAQHGKIGYIDEVMSAYRQHGGGVWSGLGRRAQLEAAIDAYETVIDNLDLRSPNVIGTHLAKRCYELATECEKEGDLGKAGVCLRKCLLERSEGLQEYLLPLGLGGTKGWRILRRRLWLYDHPLAYGLLEWTQPLVERARRLRAVSVKLGRSWLGRSTGSISAEPNPIELSHYDDHASRVATLSWTSSKTEAVEVHVGAPHGPLLSRGGPSGSATTGAWVRDGMLFFLQDVSGGLPLSSGNTLDCTTVRVLLGTEANRLAQSTGGPSGS